MNLPENNRLFNYTYLARQPIFNNAGSIWGYELLYRSGLDKQEAEISDEDIATLCVSTCGFIQSQAFSADMKKICINFTEKLILEGAPRGLPSSVTVIEIKGDIRKISRMMPILTELKQEGYTLSVNFSEPVESLKDLYDIADIIKIDIHGKEIKEIQNIFSAISRFKTLKIAEKVDNREIMKDLRSLGCDLYQGYFFAKPVNLHGRTLKQIEVSKLRILKALENPLLSVQDLSEIITPDPGITYQLLRFINSAAFGFSAKVASIQHAINLIGAKRLKYWLRMVVMSDLSHNNDMPELYLMSLTRGKFFEELAGRGLVQGSSPETMFLFGLLSLIEPMLEVSIDNVLDQLPLADNLKSGYTDRNSTFGKYLQLVVAIENSDTEKIKRLCGEMGLKAKAVIVASNQALAWTNTIYQAMV